MPLYEYRCRKCGSTFEVLQKVGDRPLETCQSCGGPLQKLLSSPAIQFKGSGWYITDYAKKDSPVKSEKSPPSAAKDSKPKAASSSSKGDRFTRGRDQRHGRRS